MERSRVFSQGGPFGYLEPQDRYLFQDEQPRFRFAFIGCGIMGQEHMRNTLLEGRAEVTGVYDTRAASIAHALESVGKYGQQQAPKVYASLADVCADASIDAIFVATPNHTHVDVMREVFNSGNTASPAIYLEKPLATTVNDAAEICRASANYPGIVQIGLQYRYKAIYREAIEEVLQRGALGAVHSINMLEHRFPFLDKAGQWNKFDEFTGGTLVEKCCHYFDLINLFAGARARRVYATGRQAVNFREFEYQGRAANGLDNANVLIEFENDVQANFSLCMHVPGSYEELTLCGERGRLQATEQNRLGERNANRVELWVADNGASKTTQPAYPRIIESAGHHGSTFYAHVDFVELLLGQKPATPTLDDAFWAVLVASAAQQSIVDGAPVEVASLLPAGYEASAATAQF